MINIAVISDIKIYFEGLSQILSKNKSIKIVSSANTVDDAISNIHSNTPDVALLDMTMRNSHFLAGKINSVSPRTKIIALAVPYDEKNIIQCAEAGILCYVEREASLDDLVDAIVGANKGECYCPPKITLLILKKFQSLIFNSKNKISLESTCKQSHPLDLLTRREKQVAKLLSDALSNKQIARNLCIEVSTVKNHVHNILVKLDISSRVQAVSLLQNVSRSINEVNITNSLALDVEMV